MSGSALSLISDKGVLELNMRKLLLFIMSAAMVFSGLYLLAGEFLWAPINFWRIFTGVMLITLGVMGGLYRSKLQSR